MTVGNGNGNGTLVGIPGLLEVARRWGIFAAMTTVFFTCLIWYVLKQEERRTEQENYIRTELMREVQRGSENRLEIVREIHESTEMRGRMMDLISTMNKTMAVLQVHLDKETKQVN